MCPQSPTFEAAAPREIAPGPHPALARPPPALARPPPAAPGPRPPPGPACGYEKAPSFLGAVRGSDRCRSGDLSIFSRTLYQLSYRALMLHSPVKSPGSFASATPTGLEPATSAVTGRRANQLRYGALLVQDLDSVVPPTGFEPVLPP